MTPADWSFHTEIEWLLSHGWYLLPVDGKRPTIRWREQSSNDPEIVHGWFRQAGGRLGVGVDTGKSGLYVIDVDKGAGGFESLALLPERLPTTMVVRTGGLGIHAYFKLPEDLELTNSAGRLPTADGWISLPGIDSRSTGGFVVAPPSRHKSGNRYRWISGKQLLEPADLPGWIRPAEKAAPLVGGDRTSSVELQPSSGGSVDRYLERAVRGEVGDVRMAGKGSRNDQLVRSSFSLGTLIGAGLSRTFLEDVLLAAATECGLSEREARPTIRNGLDAGERSPRSIS